jgi:hypothetical protein
LLMVELDQQQPLMQEPHWVLQLAQMSKPTVLSSQRSLRTLLQLMAVLSK